MSVMLASLKRSFHSFAEWSQVYTKTDMLYVMHGGFWLTLAKGIGIAVSLLVATAMANLVAPEVFGMYRFVLAGAGIIGALSLTGMSSVIVQSVARGYEGALRAGARDYLRWSFISVAVSLGVASYYFVQENTALTIGFLLVAALNPLLSAYSFFTQFISGKKDFRTQALFDTIADIIPAACLVVALFVIKNPIAILLVYFLIGILTNIVLYYATLRKFRPNDHVDPAALPFVKHLSFMGILGKVGENIDKILVFHYLGAAPLALYAFAQTPIAQLKLLADIPVRVALPKLSERPLSELRSSLPRKTFILTGVMFAVVVVYVGAAPFLFKFLFPAYGQAVIYTQLLALSLIFTPSAMFSAALTAHTKKRELYISQAILPILKIGLFVIFLPLYGIWGAIWVTIVHQFITFAVFGYLFWQAKS